MAIRSARPMDLRWKRALWATLSIGALAQAIVAFATVGDQFDMNSFASVEAALHHQPLDVYSRVNH